MARTLGRGCRIISLRIAIAVGTLTTLVAATPAIAVGDFHLLYGGVQGAGRDSRSSGYQLGYEESLGAQDRLAAGFTYLNEGHFVGHHRDGFAAQVWGRWRPGAGRLRLSAGVGPYWYFDTAASQGSGSFADVHGVGVLYSLAGTYDLSRHLFIELRANRSDSRASFNATSAFLGVGLHIDQVSVDPATDGSSRWLARDYQNEISVALGTTVANSFAGEKSRAGHLQYRRRLVGPLEATVAWLDEGDPKLLSRQGVSGQLWLVRRFGGDRYELGVGYGPYFGLDHRAPVDGQDRSRVSGRLTMSMGYRFAAAWIARLSVNRIVTNYNRDTDVFLLGVGYLF